ncbi:major capsid family protein [Burkholderia multivorans]|uniref:major capsid family protein n=1 Tax=Burkholderia multivorans TaxID=87883 RepID=UPI0019552674|nr:major capsid family protein [Burkholderia multivorans]
MERKFGIHMPLVQDYIKKEYAQDYSLAMDAQPSLVTVSNSGIPSYLANYIDPDFIEVLVSPVKAAQILGEEKKGDWTTLTATFPIIESTGQVSSYGDFNTNGSTGANANFPQRQSYHYQTMTEWGERELDMAALAKINWANELNIASAKVLTKFQNKSYFFGIAGLQNYGLLNDPSLPPAATPATKAAGGTTWANATADEVYKDVQTLFTNLVNQTGGIVEATDRMVLATSPAVAVAFTKTNQYNVNVYDQLKKNFPNIRFETAVEYAVTGGNLVQLIAEELDGQRAGYVAFTEKMRAHAVVRDTSSFKQKKSQGTWGAIVRVPAAFSSMLGV